MLTQEEEDQEKGQAVKLEEQMNDCAPKPQNPQHSTRRSTRTRMPSRRDAPSESPPKSPRLTRLSIRLPVPQVRPHVNTVLCVLPLASTPPRLCIRMPVLEVGVLVSALSW